MSDESGVSDMFLMNCGSLWWSQRNYNEPIRGCKCNDSFGVRSVRVCAIGGINTVATQYTVYRVEFNTARWHH